MYQKIHAIPKDEPATLKGRKIIAAIEGIDDNEIRSWELVKFKKYLHEYTTINLREYEKTRVFHLKVGNTNYKLKDDPAKMTSGQFIDIVELMKSTDDPIQYMHKILAIITVKGKGYDAEGVEERAKQIQDTLLKDSWGVFVFFLNLYWRYLEITETYLEAEMARTINSATELLKEGGRGL